VRAFLDDADPDGSYADFICSLDGQSLELSVEVLDFGDRTGEASLVVTARTDPAQSCP